VKVYIQISNTIIDEILLKGPTDLHFNSGNIFTDVKKYGDKVRLKDHLTLQKNIDIGTCAAKLILLKVTSYILKSSE
jgi:hypothetical protein